VKNKNFHRQVTAKSGADAILAISAFIVVSFCNCSNSELHVSESLIAGHWLTTQPETTPDIILDNSGNFFMLLKDTTSSDTLHFTYSLKGNTMTIFYSPKLWISRNDIIKLSSDSLVYVRKDDNVVFRYGKK
jgi:hypothetical protein